MPRTLAEAAALSKGAPNGPVCPAFGPSDHQGRARRATALVASLFFFAAPRGAEAFHDGGPGYCLGCHAVSRGAVTPPEMSTSLIGADASSTCLRCHATTTAAHTPAGSFAWLDKSFAWQSAGVQTTSHGSSHGHNVIAAEYGLDADLRLDVAPGGRYLARDLACTSCHDPHARGASGVRTTPITTPAPTIAELRAEKAFRVAHPRQANGTPGPYRLLASLGYLAPGGDPFTHAAPIAVANSDRDTDVDHPIYVSGISEWCANCHDGMARPGHAHANGRAIGVAKADAYRSFTASLRRGSASGYFALVPFELGVSPSSSTAATDPPTASARVMCLTCHRAHASAFPSIGRWDFDVTFMADSHPARGDLGASATDPLDAYQGRDLAAELAPRERQLCNACHALR